MWTTNLEAQSHTGCLCMLWNYNFPIMKLWGVAQSCICLTMHKATYEDMVCQTALTITPLNIFGMNCQLHSCFFFIADISIRSSVMLLRLNNQIPKAACLNCATTRTLIRDMWRRVSVNTATAVHHTAHISWMDLKDSTKLVILSSGWFRINLRTTLLRTLSILYRGRGLTCY